MEMLFELFKLYDQRLIYIKMPFLHLVFSHLNQMLVKVVVLATTKNDAGNSLCEVSDSTPFIFIARRQRACFAIIF